MSSHQPLDLGADSNGAFMIVRDAGGVPGFHVAFNVFTEVAELTSHCFDTTVLFPGNRTPTIRVAQL